MNTNWSAGKDATATYSLDCSATLQITCASDFTICQSSAAGVCNLPFSSVSIPATVVLDFAERALTYTNVSVNGGGNSIIVAPGTPMTLSYNYSVVFDQINGYCPGCVVQSSIGIGSTFQTLRCESSINNGYTSNPTINFTAPSTPGIYYLTQEGSLDYFCQEFKFNNLPANAIAVLIVGPPYPLVSGGVGAVTVTNDAPACLPVGTTLVTWTATDANSNTATCTQNITVTAATIYYRDRDGDGFGQGGYPVYACSQPTGFILDNTDCNDYAFGQNCPTAAALNFDGNDDAIEHIGYVLPVNNSPYTVSVWAKQDAYTPGTFKEMVAQGRHFYIGQNAADNTLRIGDDWYGTGFAWPTDVNWHNYTVVRTTDNTFFYFDAVLSATAGYAIPTPDESVGFPASQNFYIGSQWSGSGNESWNGSVDELRVWSKALTAAEVLKNLNCEITSARTGLVATYNFNQGFAASANSTETVLTDASGNGNNATLQNFALNGATSNWVTPGAVVTGTVCCDLTLTTSAADSLIVCIESGQTLGNVSLIPTGGTAPYIFGGDDTTNLAPGNYNYTVTDANGCVANASLNVQLTNCIIPYRMPLLYLPEK